MKRRSKVDVGTRWGRLTVLEFSSRQPITSHTRWRVRCDCGTIFVVWGYSLVKGQTLTCGCGKCRKWATEHKKKARIGGSQT